MRVASEDGRQVAKAKAEAEAQKWLYTQAGNRFTTIRQAARRTHKQNRHTLAASQRNTSRAGTPRQHKQRNTSRADAPRRHQQAAAATVTHRSLPGP